MILHGDELGRTQQGNNNGYCQDSELTWVNWDSVDQPLIEFTAAVNSLRAKHPTFRRSRFFDGRPVRRGEGERLPDIVWLDPDGNLMQPEDWDSGFGRSVGMFLNGDGIQGHDDRGRRITDVNFLLYFNAHDGDVEFTLPPDEYAPAWDVIIDTAGEGADSEPANAGSLLSVAAKSLVVLRAHSAPEEEPDHSVAASLAALTQTATAETAALTAPAIPEPAKTKKPAVEAAPEPVAEPVGEPGAEPSVETAAEPAAAEPAAAEPAAAEPAKDPEERPAKKPDAKPAGKRGGHLKAVKPAGEDA
jgi:glycogen operon protein